MKAVILDASTLGDDIDLSAIECLVSELKIFSTTEPEHLAANLSDADLILCNKVVIPEQALVGRKAVFVLATGTNNIDTAAAEKLKVPVFNVNNYGAVYVAQHTVMLILALAARLPLYQRDVVAGGWQSSPIFCLNQHATTQLQGKNLVLQGGGHIGNRVAEIATAFGMRIQFAARPNDESDRRPNLESLLPQADVVSFHCPLNESTRHILHARNIGFTKPDCLIVNCARGGVIDELAALTALRQQRIAGLAVDVLPNEPPVAGHGLISALNDGLNLIVTPHNAWISPESRQNIVALTAENIARFLRAN